MLSHIALRRQDRLTAGLLLGVIAFLCSAVACDKVPLLAPTGSVISLFASATSAPLNGSIEIVATVIENGTTSTPGTGTGNSGSSTTAAGTPVHNGTLVSFTTTIGHIEPSEARTNNGEVRVRLMTGGQSGSATVTARSGGASATLSGDNAIKVGSAAAARLTLTANPQSLSSTGGTSTIAARVEDTGGTGLPGVPVTFTTTAGSVNPVSTTTNDLGVATTQLSSTTQADVTATSGAQSGKVTVGVRARIDLGVTASPNPTSTGVPTIFTVTSGTGSNVVSTVIEFGDGSSQSLGAISASRTVAHVYGSFGTYTASVTATDASGERATGLTTVIVGSLQFTVTASPASATVGVPVTFTATVPNTVPVARFQWTYDDGTTQTTTGSSTQRVFESRGTKVIRVDVIGVDGSIIGTATAQITVS